MKLIKVFGLGWNWERVNHLGMLMMFSQNKVRIERFKAYLREC
jgi:hypothetical protein